MAHHLFLVGYRGCGKSSVGRRLGDILGLPATDSDNGVEQAAGKSIRSIFSEDGEPVFRDFESQAIQTLAEGPESIISLGGGAILREQNRGIIKGHGLVVWLQASVDEIAQRIAEDSLTKERRPALTQLAALDEIAHLLEIREPIYREVADFTVQTDRRAINDIASEIARWYSESKRPGTSEHAR